MGKLVKIFIVLLFYTNTAFSAINGGVEYKIPIDYSQINEEEFGAKADSLFSTLAGRKTSEVDESMTEALNLYTALSMTNPENISYVIKLGRLYDIIGKDRQAKGNFYKAIGINQADPEAYFYLGEFFFEREQYRRALKFYKKAYERGYQSHPETVNKMKIIFKKFCDKSGLEVLN